MIIKQFIIPYIQSIICSCNVKASHCLYYSREYDSDYDDDEDIYEFAEAIHNDRTEFFQVVMICVELTVRLISFIQIRHSNTYR